MSQKQTLEGSKVDTTKHPQLNIPFLDLNFDLRSGKSHEGDFGAGDDLASKDVGIVKVIEFFEVLVSEP
jgi:hypothetical protein